MLLWLVFLQGDVDEVEGNLVLGGLGSCTSSHVLGPPLTEVRISHKATQFLKQLAEVIDLIEVAHQVVESRSFVVPQKEVRFHSRDFSLDEEIVLVEEVAKDEALRQVAIECLVLLALSRAQCSLLHIISI